MAATPIRRVATLFLILAVPALGVLTWLTWQSLENGVQAERQRVLRFEELAGSYVANSLRFELDRIRLMLSPADPSAIFLTYRAQARFPLLVKSVAFSTALETPDSGFRLENPVVRLRLTNGKTLEIRYSVGNLLQTVIPTLVHEAFSTSGDSPAFEAWVIRGAEKGKRPDWMGTLEASLIDPPAIPDLAPIRQYVTPVADRSWRLGVRVLPDGLEGYLRRFEMRSLFSASALFAVFVVSAVLFLMSLMRIFGTMRREHTFSALVSHELKTPLAALSSLSENLAAGVVAEPPRVKEYGALLLEQTDRIGEMVGKILAMSNLESAGVMLKREEFDVVLLTREMTASLGVVAESPVLTWNVRGNRDAIRAALDNLLTNARRYGAKPGEKPLIEVELIPGYQWGTRWVGISVSDHGPGLTDDEKAVLFQPYFRGRQAHLHQNPGSGIGLRIVWSTMRHLGGRVQVKSVPGGGLCVILWLREGRRI